MGHVLARAFVSAAAAPVGAAPLLPLLLLLLLPFDCRGLHGQCPNASVQAVIQVPHAAMQICRRSTCIGGHNNQQQQQLQLLVLRRVPKSACFTRTGARVTRVMQSRKAENTCASLLRNAGMTASRAVTASFQRCKAGFAMFASNCNACVQGCHARAHGCAAHVSLALKHVSKSVMQACEYKFPLLTGKFQWRHDDAVMLVPGPCDEILSSLQW